MAGVGFAANLGELAKIASLTWDATMDFLSALMTLDGAEATGQSTVLRQYARHNLPREVYVNWKGPARLHNFQHKPDHSETAFRESCHYTGIFLEQLNNLLPARLQLLASCWDWLVRR